MEREPVWLEPGAARSLKSFHAQAAYSLQRLHKRDNGTLVDDRVTFISLARSGARIDKGLFERQEDDNDLTGFGQLIDLPLNVGQRQVDALLISIGGKDIGFADSLKEFVASDFPTLWTPPVGDEAQARRDVVDAAKTALAEDGDMTKWYDEPGKYLHLLQGQDLLRVIYITTYPIRSV